MKTDTKCTVIFRIYLTKCIAQALSHALNVIIKKKKRKKKEKEKIPIVKSS